MSERAFNPSQPLVNQDGTPVYEFQDFLTEVDTAIQGAELVSVWGGISGSIDDQDDLIAGGGFLDSLVLESNVTQHQGALSVSFTQVTGTLADAQVVSSNVTQHEGDLTISWSQIISPVYVPPEVTDVATDPYTLALGDANKVLRFTTASPSVTIPQESSVNFPVGTEIRIRQAGTGTLSLTTTGLTINGTPSAWAQDVEVLFRKVGSDEWDVV